MDKSPVIEQVKSGFKIAGAILTSFAAITLFIVGYADVTTPDTVRAGLVAATIGLLLFGSLGIWAGVQDSVEARLRRSVHISQRDCPWSIDSQESIGAVRFHKR